MDGSRARRAEGQRKPPPPPASLAVPAVDSHCHLDLMCVEPGATLAAAQAVGIVRIVTIGIDLASSRWAADTAAAHDGIAATVAIHPNEAAAGVDDATLDVLAQLAALPQVVGVGETGLDHYRTTDSEAQHRQEESFRAHIGLAKQAGKALVIHDRDAHADVLRVLTEEGPPERVVFHCFSGDAEMARICADAGYVMSFAGNVTFESAGALREAAAVVPAELLLVETDAPFLTPMPYRGRPNSPVLIPLTVRALAAVRGESEARVAAAVSATAERIFGAF